MRGLLRMRQPLYGEHNYTHELNIQVRSRDRITAHASASLWRTQLHPHELNIQVRSHDRISAHVCWFPVYRKRVRETFSDLQNPPSRYISLTSPSIFLSYISVLLTRDGLLYRKNPLFYCRFLLLQ
jgi:hypothetical protein